MEKVREDGEIQEFFEKISEGNFGAIRVLTELGKNYGQDLSMDMFYKLLDNGYTGEGLWMLYKDRFHQKILDLGHYINSELYRKLRSTEEERGTEENESPAVSPSAIPESESVEMPRFESGPSVEGGGGEFSGGGASGDFGGGDSGSSSEDSVAGSSGDSGGGVDGD